MTRIAIGGISPAGVKWPNYVNGRWLTAQDLTAGRDAEFARDRWLGLAVGTGVVRGLEVSGSPGASVLQVSPGTGVSPGGTAVHLDTAATLDLTAVASSAPVDGALFADCRPPTTSTLAPSAGAYLLVMRPTSSYDGKVPVQGAPTATLPTPCTSRWEVEDVAFVAIPLDEFTATTTAANRRNLLAHWCFGSAQLSALAMSGFTRQLDYRGVDRLADLTDCDLPLAVFDWDGKALVFVDRWPARRRTVRPPATVALAEVTGDERTADGEARFLQFQDQLAELATTAAGRAVRALDVFPLLPPAGLVPINPLATALALYPRKYIAPSGKDLIGRRMMVRGQDTGLKQLLLEAKATAQATGHTSVGGLGALSERLLQMQQDIDALSAEVDDLKTRLDRGSAGGNNSASARAEGRRMAETVAGLLADAAGDGFDPSVFFSGLQFRLGVVDHETVDFTIRRSWYDEPIYLGDGGVLNLFFVMSSDGEAVAPYLLFAKRQRGIRWVDFAARTFDG